MLNRFGGLSKMKKKELDELVLKLFRLCDQYVDIKNFVEFEDKFSKIVKKQKVDLHELYYGMPYKEMKKQYRRYDSLKKKKD